MSTHSDKGDSSELPLYTVSCSIAIPEQGARPRSVIRLAEAVCTSQYSLLACVLSNLDYVVLRFVDVSGMGSIVRYFPWFSAESVRRPEALAYDPHGEWLLAVAHDGSIHLIPQLALLAQDLERSVHWSSGFVPVDQISSTDMNRDLVGVVSCCCWWTTVGGAHIAIVGTRDGNLKFVSLPQGNVEYSMNLQDSIERLEVVADDETSKYLLVHAARLHRIQLEDVEETESGIAQVTIMTSRELQVNGVEILQRFARTTQVKPQRSRGKLLIGAHDPLRDQRLHIFDKSLDIPSPLYVLQLCHGIVDLLLTDDLCLSATAGKSPMIIVSSNLLSGTSSDADTEQAEHIMNRSVLQRLPLPTGQRVLAVHPLPKAPDQLQAFTVICSNGVFDVRPDRDPENIFLELVQQGRDAEPLGASLRLDLKTLYEQGAMEASKLGDHFRALELYMLAQSPHQRVIPVFVKHRRMDYVAYYLEKALRDPAAFTGTIRRGLSQLLLFSYLQQLCTVSQDADGSIVDANDEKDRMLSTDEIYKAFVKLIADNWDYHVESALLVLLNYGMLNLYMDVATARQLEDRALKRAVELGTLGLPSRAKQLLLNKGHSNLVASCHSGILLRNMSAEEQLQFITADAVGLGLGVKQARDILHDLDERSLVSLATYFDPARPLVWSLIQRQRNRVKSISSTGRSTPAPVAEDPDPSAIVELFLEILLWLAKARRMNASKQDHNQPWRLDTADLFAPESMGNFQSPMSPPQPRKAVSPIVGGGNSDSYDYSSKLCLGQNHGAVVLDSDVYSWGKAKNGRLGHGDIVEEQDSSPICRVEILDIHKIKIAGVACGAEHTMAFGPDGLYAWGAGAHGKLGLGDEDNRNMPQLVPEVGRVKQVACGGDFTLALLADWTPLAWGCGSRGQLGVGDVDDHFKPVRIKGLDEEQCVHVAAGKRHSGICTASGSVYLFGDNRLGQLGRISPAMMNTPAKAALSRRWGAVKAVQCGVEETAIVCVTGMYTCGGKLPDGLRAYFEKVPIPFEASEIKQISMGSEHGLILSVDGRVAAWGQGEQGQLGLGPDVQFAQEADVIQPLQDCVTVSAGGCFSAALDATGQIWLWGQGHSGELGNGSNTDAQRQIFVPKCAFTAAHWKTATDTLSIMELPRTPPGNIAISDDNQDGYIYINYDSDPPALVGDFQQPMPDEDEDEDDDLASRPPDFSRSKTTPYPYISLGVLLFKLEGRYRVATLLRKCFDFRDWDGAACIYIQLKDYENAYRYRVRSLLGFLNTIDDKSERMGSALKLITETTPPFWQNTAKDFVDSNPEHMVEIITAILLLLLDFWDSMELDTPSLQSLLHNEINIIGNPLSNLVQLALDSKSSMKGQNVASDKISQHLTNFSTDFYAAITSHAPGSAVMNPAKDSAHVSQDRLWSEVLLNLTKDMEARANITIDCPPVTTNSSFQHSDTLIFTCCKHAPSRRQLHEMDIPEFKRRAAALPVPLIKSTKLICENYLKNSVSMACPRCLFGKLRRESLATHPGAHIPSWDVSLR
eukprot:m.69931 g.69931  ORF g.69931 m.69931 type:complete len:1528 (+) comp12093_c0_seq7:85-4668(+)